MSSFGEKLKRERESRNKSVEEIALATGIQLRYLEALERNESRSLPGRAFGKLYIRAYAEILGFDPQSLIDEYEREMQLQQAVSAPRRPEPVKPRRVEAAIARWREARIQDRSAPEPGAEPVEVERQTLEASRADAPGVLESDARETLDEGPVEIEPPQPAQPARPAQPHGAAEVVASPVATEQVSKPRSSARRPLIVALVLFCLLLGAAVTYFKITGTEIERKATPAIPSANEARKSDPPPVAPAREPEPVGVAKPPPAPASPIGSPGEAGDGGHLSVSESGVGRRIVNRRLEGESTRFAPGDVAWFSTRVVGGKPGDFIRHVWLYEGRAVQSIQLAVDGPNWRTHSSRRLGDSGRWMVEARDESGRVLARVDFDCATGAP